MIVYWQYNLMDQVLIILNKCYVHSVNCSGLFLGIYNGIVLRLCSCPFLCIASVCLINDNAHNTHLKLYFDLFRIARADLCVYPSNSIIYSLINIKLTCLGKYIMIKVFFKQQINRKRKYRIEFDFKESTVWKVIKNV